MGHRKGWQNRTSTGEQGFIPCRFPHIMQKISLLSLLERESSAPKPATLSHGSLKVSKLVRSCQPLHAAVPHAAALLLGLGSVWMKSHFREGFSFARFQDRSTGLINFVVARGFQVQRWLQYKRCMRWEVLLEVAYQRSASTYIYIASS